MVKKLIIVLLLVVGGAAQAHAALEDYFVSTRWLADNLGKVRVVDVRKAAGYLFGHIPGAVNVERSEFLSTRNGTKSLVPTADEFVALMSRLGITADTPVVAYTSDSGSYSARFVWTLRFHGHEKAYVLDGGYDKWKKEGRNTEMMSADQPPATKYVLNHAPDIRAEEDYVLTRLDHPDTLVWDTRRTSEYQGTEVRAARGGHIPGAIHLNWTELQTEVNGVRVLKSKKELLSLLADRGITPDKEILAHCQTGIRSSYATLVLLGLGYPRAKNYDGSWIEWAHNPDLPVVDPARVAGKIELPAR
ncbi:thiosulfate sulfurtransferase [Geothermobacter hydrogeniphilus]|uniref:Sulfurtransferase n=1 Tax=Geothermobacter hydrogeniphilus TaxID=1969733 RepID=A0A2K2HED7_9BACT|nr:sulfurtransferase [Geothermobacter hydrogeniphilus]PNU21658.1 thiosulfate sulfurtransferase [Geothermobacter hydrogeniphilus]